MQKTKNPMPMQDPIVRQNNFSEVALGYTWEEALREAERCLQCKHKPCVTSCPVNVSIPEFIQAILDKDINKAAEIIYETNCFPSICGRVCPQEVQCEKTCVMGIRNEPVAIGRLERFVGDLAQVKSTITPVAKGKVAIVGSGPAGLACAYDCAKAGLDVTVFEAWHDVGGVLRYGIPEFRLPKKIVDREIDTLRDLHVKFEVNTVIGKTLSCDDLFDMGFDAMFLGTGAGLPKFLGIKNEGAVGVLSANEFLTRVNFMKANQKGYDTPILQGKDVVVIGGGNVAMDSARCARRLGYKTTIVYRRAMEQLPARHEEIEHAIEEGIEFSILHNPVEFLKDDQGRVSGVVVDQMVLSDVDEWGRRGVISTNKPLKTIKADTVIVAIGTSPNPIITRCTADLKTQRNGTLVVDESLQTTISHIYAGGDAVTGAATVIEALGAGKKAAASIIADLST